MFWLKVKVSRERLAANAHWHFTVAILSILSIISFYLFARIFNTFNIVVSIFSVNSFIICYNCAVLNLKILFGFL